MGPWGPFVESSDKAWFSYAAGAPATWLLVLPGILFRYDNRGGWQHGTSQSTAGFPAKLSRVQLRRHAFRETGPNSLLVSRVANMALLNNKGETLEKRKRRIKNYWY